MLESSPSDLASIVVRKKTNINQKAVCRRNEWQIPEASDQETGSIKKRNSVARLTMSTSGRDGTLLLIYLIGFSE